MPRSSAGCRPASIIRPVYDRSDLIHRAIETLTGKLVEESLIVALVCLVFLVHARSALVAVLTLPVGILIAFLLMRWVGVNADIMSLGGIAIAIGAMIDAAIVMIENMHKHLERHRRGTAAALLAGAARRNAGRWSAARHGRSGPALFFSLLIITVSFLPVFALEGQEGRLFKPLAFTKTFAMAAASLLSVTLVPVAMGLFIRGRIIPERRNPLNRALVRLYRPLIGVVLRHRVLTLAMALAVLILSWIPWSRIGGEFMPPLDEGTVLFMPTTLPGASVARAREMLRIQDAALKAIPEVATVWGKAGRAETATDPAGLDMFETTITLKPESEWRPGMTSDRLIAVMDSAVRLPGVTNAWTMPIKGRIDMLATGIRTPVGVKIFGPDLGRARAARPRGRSGTADGARHPQCLRRAGRVGLLPRHRHRPGGRGATWSQRGRRADRHRHRHRRHDRHPDRRGTGALWRADPLSPRAARQPRAAARRADPRGARRR